ncbi:MAG: LamG-like jellyroll fold domain-containing protein, partial [Armatimonadota bacterium]
MQIPRPLIAYWDFDELFGGNCLDASGKGHDATPEGGRSRGLRRMRGLFGNAMSLSGSHMLRVPGGPDFDGLAGVALSAWTLPTDLSGYREIFRKEDGDRRVLFSYQLDGTVLSLGLNVDGYVECDAAIDPAVVLDGQWHHCAATFDGRHMRVYLDGREVGSLQRPGVIAGGGRAPGCIGSNNGGENFQGAMDDLRIYSEALSPDEVRRLYENGKMALARLADGSAADEPEIDQPLLAHWTFNEAGSSPTIGESSGDARLEVKRAALRTRGVHGNALDLLGRHALRTAGAVDTREFSGITFSAWTKPTELRAYREIFRKEDGNRRLLFSFQHNGTILSLGLNINGYVECDAAIDPRQVLDGRWHHCAGTFDGEYMRVYLDGREVGSLQRPGVIAADPTTPGFIGSLNGEREHFQGALDDLRIYRAALSAEEIGLLHGAGVRAIERFVKRLEGQLRSFYAERETFAETLAETRRRLLESEARLGPELADFMVEKLRSRFPEECDDFTKWTGASPMEYIVARGDRFQMQEAERMVELLLEYKPLTEAQQAKQTPDAAERWKEAERIERRLRELRARGEAARFSPEWIEIIFEAAQRINFRPYISEAVAPYVKPETPPTRNLTKAQAREVLERDWLHQANQDPTPERIRSEIAWTRQLASRIELSSPGDLDFARELSELNELKRRAEALSSADRELYFEVRTVKRRVMFRNPAVDFEQVLFVDMPFPQGSEWRHQTRHRLGYMAVPGGRLLVLRGLSPEGKLRQLMPQPPLHGSFWRPDVSYDGNKVLFCFKPHNEKSFHLYEIEADGTGLVQLTDGPYDDLDPVYLPDGQHLIFSTTRGHTYVRCMPPTNAYVLARCDRRGRSIYLISANNEPDYLPSVMGDGRIIYTRWEYTDKPLWRAQGLWTINPDGTQVNTFWGNQSVWPDLLKDARSIPGGKRVMFTGSAHHDWFGGSVGIVDPEGGLNFPRGLSKVTADVAWPEVG